MENKGDNNGDEQTVEKSGEIVAKASESSVTELQQSFDKQIEMEDNPNSKKNGEQNAKATKAEIVETKKRIYLPPETWEQVFAWIRRIELAERISLVCRRFHGILYPWLHLKNNRFPAQNCRKMRPLEITEWNAHKLPQCPPPENIVGIVRITIRYLDSNVLAFFKQIRSLLSKELHIDIEPSTPYNIVVAVSRILPLCTGAILSARFWLGDFAEISTKVPKFLAQCQKFIVFVYFSFDLPKLANWLSEPKDNGQPKLLIMQFIGIGRIGKCKLLVEQVKENFRLANVLSPFFIRFNYDGWEFEAFNGQNPRTEEQLSIELVENPRRGQLGAPDHFVLITRCAIGEQIDQAIEAAKQKLLNWPRIADYEAGKLRFAVYGIGNLGDGIVNLVARKSAGCSVS